MVCVCGVVQSMKVWVYTPGSLGSVAGPEYLPFSWFPGDASAEARETHFE